MNAPGTSGTVTSSSLKLIYKIFILPEVCFLNSVLKDYLFFSWEKIVDCGCIFFCYWIKHNVSNILFCDKVNEKWCDKGEQPNS